MCVAFERITLYPQGTLLRLLEDAYAFEPRYAVRDRSSWNAFDHFFYEQPTIAEHCGLMTVLNGEPIGFVSWDPRKRPESVEIGYNCIVAAQKGNGYGKRQLQEAIVRILQKPTERIVVTTDDLLLAAQRTYESAGFRLVRKRPAMQTGSFVREHFDYEYRSPLV